MIWAVFRVALLRLVRDRGALVMTFVLPSVIFVIFAAIFGGSAGGDISVRVSATDQTADETGARLIEALQTAQGVAVRVEQDIDAVRVAVANGSHDVGLIIERPLADSDTSPLRLLITSANELPSSMLIGHIQERLAADLPDIALRRQANALTAIIGALDPVQQAGLEQAIGALDGQSAPANSLIVIESVDQVDGPADAVTYYAGAVAILFLLFSSVQGAVGIVEERLSGVRARLALSSGGAGVLIGGRFLFLTAQGTAQALVIFIVAWVFYGVDWLGVLPAWGATTVLAAAAASGLALALCTLSASREQAFSLSNFTVLILSAIGGSMAPRFLMPEWLRDLGWITPNAWAIEAYNGALGQGGAISAMADGWLGLSVFAALGLGLAIIAEGRKMRA